MIENDISKALCFTPLETIIELRNVQGKVTLNFKFIS